MKIFTLEGLPLVGKSTIGMDLCAHFNSIGIKSIYRHGQITNNEAANRCIKKAFECLDKWDYSNHEGLYDFIKYRYEQIYIDFIEFQDTYEQFIDVEYLFLDRYIDGHDVTASIFGYTPPNFSEMINFSEFLTIEFLLICGYKERKRRAQIRKKTNNLTKYSVINSDIHSLMQDRYIYFSQNNDKGKIVLSDSSLDLKKCIIGEINERLLLR
ncbi:hypothetical protein ACSLGG_31080 (plasmid) [Bacillus mycoides]|uniref:hypothetical protein n=1 Tax=Bacillus mycoides TaxID=1405 RepID=UPI003F756970